MTDISRRSFLKLLPAALLSLCLPGLKAASASSKSDIIFLRQLMAEDPCCRTIMWHSLQPHGNVQLQYKLNDAAASVSSISPKTDKFTLGDEDFYICTARLESLQPGHIYSYQVIQDNEASDWQKLSVPAANQPFKALIFPDSQCSDGYATWHNVAETGFSKNTDAAFFVNMGDLVDNGAAMFQWRQWFQAIEKHLPQLPFAPVMGNHETYNLQWLCHLPKAFLSFFALPGNGSLKWQRYYYDFTYGSVHFIVLNTMMEELDPLQPGLLDSQLPWLTQVVKASTAKWQVVLMHKDIINYEAALTDNPYDSIDPVGRVFMPYFDELNIDLVLTAHQHTYRRHDHIKNFRPALDGPVYIDTGNAGNCRYDVPRTRHFDKVMLPQPEVDNYLTLTDAETKLTVNCYSHDGLLMDSCTLAK